MLYKYLQSVQRYIWDLKQELMRPADITFFVNQARSQIAGESEAIRLYGTFSTVANQNVYPFSGIGSIPSGVAAILNVRMVSITNSGVTTQLNVDPWEWFNSYFLCQAPSASAPTDWAQFGQGTAGTLYLGPTPNGVFTINVDCVCQPSDLVTDSSVEALPFPWTDAVPFYAAYLAYMSAQKSEHAANMFVLYEKYVQRARSMATPSVNSQAFPQNTPLGRPSPMGQIAPQPAAQSGSVFPQFSGVGGSGGQRGQ